MKQWRSLHYVVNAHGQRGRVDRVAIFYSRLTLGGFGWIDQNSVVVRRDKRAIDQFIGLTGHSNDDQHGRPLLPTMELPF